MEDSDSPQTRAEAQAEALRQGQPVALRWGQAVVLQQGQPPLSLSSRGPLILLQGQPPLSSSSRGPLHHQGRFGWYDAASHLQWAELASDGPGLQGGGYAWWG